MSQILFQSVKGFEFAGSNKVFSSEVSPLAPGLNYRSSACDRFYSRMSSYTPPTPTRHNCRVESRRRQRGVLGCRESESDIITHRCLLFYYRCLCVVAVLLKVRELFRIVCGVLILCAFLKSTSQSSLHVSVLLRLFL